MDFTIVFIVLLVQVLSDHKTNGTDVNAVPSVACKDWRIAGGTTATIKEFPFMVSIWVDDGKVESYRGGGSYVRRLWILSAAKIFKMPKSNVTRPIGDYRIKMGSVKLFDPNAQTRHAFKLYSHPFYANDGYSSTNNIVLVQLKRSFKLGRSVAYVKLPTTPEKYGQINCAVAGWGRHPADKDHFTKTALTLRRTDVALLNASSCKLSYPRCGKNIDENSVMCAGNPKEGKGICYGDYGGPLVCKNVQVGVASWSTDCGGDHPGIFTRVDYYVAWFQITFHQEIDERSSNPRLVSPSKLTTVIVVILVCKIII